MKIKKGDNVIMLGGKDKGKKGETETSDINNIAPAWTQSAKTITYKNYGNESIRLLPAAPAGTESSEWHPNGDRIRHHGKEASRKANERKTRNVRQNKRKTTWSFPHGSE